MKPRFREPTEWWELKPVWWEDNTAREKMGINPYRATAISSHCSVSGPIRIPFSRMGNLATRLLSSLYGIEIGASKHNTFGVAALNVDRELFGFYYHKGGAAKVDVCADGANLPFRDSTFDFVLTSHVLEHMFDVIGTLKEWYRVVKNGGIVFAIIPHKDRTFDRERPRTPLAELIVRHSKGTPYNSPDGHHSVWITQDIVELVTWLGWHILHVQDRDDKVGNGFTIVIQVIKT